MSNYYKPGTWNCICDRCGFQYKSDELRKDWKGLMVCHSCFETRHPMDFMRVRGESLDVPWTRPEPADVFIEPTVCTAFGRQGVAGVGTAGCATAGYVLPS